MILATKRRKVLAIGAHSDDVEIGCGGTIALHKEKGDKVYLLIMTMPYYDDYKNRVLRPLEVGLKEEKEAARILGAKLINLGFETKKVPYSDESVEQINEIIDKYNIDTIYTHWYHDTHQDHKRTAQSVISAARHIKNILMYEPEYPAGRSYTGFRNQYYVDVTQTFEKKIKALRCHKSQVKKYGENLFINAVEARASHRGYETGSKYAECFEVLRLSAKI